MSRRAFVESLCGGLGAVGLSGMLASDLWAASSPVGPHFAPAAKHVIFLFLTGGPSHLDLFDPKPALEKYAGQRPDSELASPTASAGKTRTCRASSC